MKQLKTIQTSQKLSSSHLQNQRKFLRQYEEIVYNKFIQKITHPGAKKASNVNIIRHSFLNKNPQIKRNIRSDKLLPSQEANNDQKIMFKTKNILLPSLQTKSGKNYQQKFISNQSIFIHEKKVLEILDDKIPQQPIAIKKHSFQQQNIKKNKNKNKIYDHTKAHSRSFLKMDKIDMIEIELLKQKSPLRQKNRRHIQTLQKLKSKETMYEYPVTSDHQKMTVYDKDQAKTLDFQHQKNQKILGQSKIKIERLISQYKLSTIKMGNISAEKKKNVWLQMYGKIQSIKVNGQQTIYMEPKPRLKKKRQSSLGKMPKAANVSWKYRQLGIKQVSKFQVTRLLHYYHYVNDVMVPQLIHYKAYIGDGNNSHLISRILKNKGYWAITDDIKQAHFIWTQLPNHQQMKSLPSHHLLKLNIHKPKIIHSSKKISKSTSIASFLQIKDCPFLQACSKLLHPTIYQKFMSQFIQRFKNNQYIKNYAYLRDIITKFYPQVTTDYQKLQSNNIKLINHCENSKEIGDKKKLFFHIEKYCEINEIDKHNMIPWTIHISQENINIINQSSIREDLLANLLTPFPDEEQLIILKPGEQTNRGNGITVHPNKASLLQFISQSLINFPENKSYIVQEYIDPLLYEGRKFDIRVWVLLSNNRVWFYRQGYVRTSCKQFTTKNMNKFIHLTNDAIQKYSDQYGKYEPANKVSFGDMDKYLRKTYNYEGFYPEIYQNIKILTKRLFQVGNLMIGRSCHQFQLFGLDFLIDKNFKVWLIQCNTNPSIQICCSLLNRLVPNMIENVISIAVDPYFPPSQRRIIKEYSQWHVQKFNFQLLHDGILQTDYLQKIINEDQEYLQLLQEKNSFKLSNCKIKSKDKCNKNKTQQQQSILQSFLAEQQPLKTVEQ